MIDRKMDMVVTVPLLTLEYFEMDLKWQQIVVEECVNEAWKVSVDIYDQHTPHLT